MLRALILFKAGDEDVTRATIIIADSKDSSRKALKDLLNRCGYLVEAEATNGPELLRKARTYVPGSGHYRFRPEGGSIPEIAGIIEGTDDSTVSSDTGKPGQGS